MKPSPKHILTVCEACGEPWELHGDKPSSDDCIRLLRAHVARAEAHTPTIIPYPVYPQMPYYPKTVPYIQPQPRIWYSGQLQTADGTAGTLTINGATTITPSN